MKKFAAIALTLALTASAACAGATTVGICQLVQHEALDAATQGFKDALTEKMPDVKFDEQNAAGDAANCVTITSKFAADGVDLILANATAPLQAAVSATGDIPILGTSITDYATALGMKDWNGTTGINVSGTSDLAPLDGQAAIIKELFPDAKNVGLVYCSAEANSIYQITVIKGYLEEMGYACTEFAFTDSNDVASVTQERVVGRLCLQIGLYELQIGICCYEKRTDLWPVQVAAVQAIPAGSAFGLIAIELLCDVPAPVFANENNSPPCHGTS